MTFVELAKVVNLEQLCCVRSEDGFLLHFGIFALVGLEPTTQIKAIGTKDRRHNCLEIEVFYNP